MGAKLTIFVCGTYRDLAEERKEVLEAIRKLQHQHDSMEFFGARSDRAIETCLDEVRQSDVLVVIVGHTYGSIVPKLKISFTEAEYEEGYRLGKPCLVYLRDDNVPVLPKFMESEPTKIKLLRRFKKTLNDRHTTATFRDAHDLSVSVTADLSRIVQNLDNARDSIDNPIAILKNGVEEWNIWRARKPSVAPNLDNVDLNHEYLRGVNFGGVSLRKANLIGADLREANLAEADLSNAILKYATLRQADLRGAVLNDTDLGETEIGYSKLENIDLSKVRGLDAVIHKGPSSINIDTVEKSKGSIPEAFLRSAGVSDLQIEIFKLLTPGLSPAQVTDITYKIHDLYLGRGMQFYSCFISYSSKDEEFARKLQEDLEKNGVRCWFAPEDMKIGDVISLTIENQIRLRDRLLVILSANSIKSEWVGDEVEAALEEESKNNRLVLFPIRLDDAVLNTHDDWAAKVKRRRHIGDFSISVNHRND